MHHALFRHSLLFLVVAFSFPSALTAETSEVGVDGTVHTTSRMVVIDAGSSGTRAHVFSWWLVGNDTSVREEAKFKVRPGLASIVADVDGPSGVVGAVSRHLDDVLASVEAALGPVEEEVPVVFAATAGVRGLPPDLQDVLLAGVRQRLHSSSMVFADSQAVVLSGQMEAAYIWAAGTQGKRSAAFDLGGASAQAVIPLRSPVGIPPSDIIQLSLGGQTHAAYAVSLQGFGRDSALRAFTRWRKPRYGSKPTPCFPLELRMDPEITDLRGPPASSPVDHTFSGCRAEMRAFLKDTLPPLPDLPRLRAAVATLPSLRAFDNYPRVALSMVAAALSVLRVNTKLLRNNALFIKLGTYAAGKTDHHTKLATSVVVTPADFARMSGAVCSKLPDEEIKRFVPLELRDQSSYYNSLLCFSAGLMLELLHAFGVADEAHVAMVLKMPNDSAGTWVTGALLHHVGALTVH